MVNDESRGVVFGESSKLDFGSFKVKNSMSDNGFLFGSVYWGSLGRSPLKVSSSDGQCSQTQSLRPVWTYS